MSSQVRPDIDEDEDDGYEGAIKHIVNNNKAVEDAEAESQRQQVLLGRLDRGEITEAQYNALSKNPQKRSPALSPRLAPRQDAVQAENKLLEEEKQQSPGKPPAKKKKKADTENSLEWSLDS